MRRNYLMNGGGTQAPGGGRKRRQRPPVRAGRGGQRKQRQRPRPSRPRGGRRGARNPITAPLTPAELRRETRAATNLKFRPLERKVGADLRASHQRVSQIGDWWKEYTDQVKQNQIDNAAAYQQAQTYDQQMMEAASTRDSANTQALDAEAKKSAELRGAEPSTAAAERETAAQAQRNLAATNEAGALANAGAAQYAYLGDKRRIGIGQSIKSRMDEQKRGRTIRQDRRDLARERGDYATTYRGEEREKERRYGIERGVAGLDKRKQRADEREGRRGAREKRGERREDRRQQRIENRRKHRELELDEQEARQKGKSGGKTPSERNAAREDRRNAIKAAQSFIAANGRPKSNKEWAGLEILLEEKSEISPSAAAFAVNRLRHRQGGPATQGNRGAKGATKVPYR